MLKLEVLLLEDLWIRGVDFSLWLTCTFKRLIKYILFYDHVQHTACI